MTTRRALVASVVLPAGVMAAWLASLPAYSVSLVVVGPLFLIFSYPTIGCARWLYEQLGASRNTDLMPRVTPKCR
jgi:hypothetical protein